MSEKKLPKSACRKMLNSTLTVIKICEKLMKEEDESVKPIAARTRLALMELANVLAEELGEKVEPSGNPLSRRTRLAR